MRTVMASRWLLLALLLAACAAVVLAEDSKNADDFVPEEFEANAEMKEGERDFEMERMEKKRKRADRRREIRGKVEKEAGDSNDGGSSNDFVPEEFEANAETKDGDRDFDVERMEKKRKRADRRREMLDEDGNNNRDARKERRRRRIDDDPRMKNMPWAMEDDERGPAFKEADTDKDGKLTAEELTAFVLKPLEEEHAKELERYKLGVPHGGPRRMDMPRDATGSEEEIADREEEERDMEKARRRHEDRIARMDEAAKKKWEEKIKRHEEKFAKRRQRDLERQSRHVNRMFPRIDRDGDGRITEEEWGMS